MGSRQLTQELRLPVGDEPEVREALSHLGEHGGHDLRRLPVGGLLRHQRRQRRRPGAEKVGDLGNLWVGQGARQDLVAHEQAEVEVSSGQRLRHLLCLSRRHGFERGDEQERRAHVAEEPVHRLRPRYETVPHRLEQHEEVG